MKPKMNHKFAVTLTFIAVLQGCSSPISNTSIFGGKDVVVVDMGTHIGLKIIEIGLLDFPQGQADISLVFDEDDQDNFTQSLIKSLKHSDVRVLPSAQTKLHIDFDEINLNKVNNDFVVKITANVTVSRNGISTHDVIEVQGEPKYSLNSAKTSSV